MINIGHDAVGRFRAEASLSELSLRKPERFSCTNYSGSMTEEQA